MRHRCVCLRPTPFLPGLFFCGGQVYFDSVSKFGLIHSLYTVILAVTLFSRIFTGEGTIGYMGGDSTEHRGQRLEQQP